MVGQGALSFWFRFEYVAKTKWQSNLASSVKQNLGAGYIWMSQVLTVHVI